MGEGTQHPLFASIFIYNLIVGFGALSLPLAFSEAGVLLSSVLILLLAVLSFVTATFVIESQAVANAVLALSPTTAEYSRVGQGVVDEESGDGGGERDSGKSNLGPGPGPGRTAPSAVHPGDDSSDGSYRDDDSKAEADNEVNRTDRVSVSSSTNDDADDADDAALSRLFSINVRTELTQMARMFRPKWSPFFFTLLSLYLIGDLAIYAAVIGKTLTAFLLPDGGEGGVGGVGGAADEAESMRRLVLLVFGCVVVPLSCLNFTKTTPLQVVSLVTRNFAIIMLIVVALHRVLHHSSDHPDEGYFSSTTPQDENAGGGGGDGGGGGLALLMQRVHFPVGGSPSGGRVPSGIRISPSSSGGRSSLLVDSLFDFGKSGNSRATSSETGGGQQRAASASTSTTPSSTGADASTRNTPARTDDDYRMVWADPSKIPQFFGIAVYSFMCHHSLPSIVTPMASKRRVLSLVAADYAFIAVLYLLLCGTAVMAFGGVNGTT